MNMGRSRMGGVLSGALLALLGCVGAGCGASISPKPVATTTPVAMNAARSRPEETPVRADGRRTLRRTQIVTVRPTTSRGKLKRSYVVTKEVNGECVPYSKAVSGESESCNVGDGGYGPCWPGDAGAPPRVVYCLSHPWEHGVVLVHASFSQWPPAREKAVGPLLLALELGDGRRCLEVYSTPSEVHGKTLRWFCGEQAGDIVELFEEFSHRGKLWIVTEVFLSSEYKLLKIGPRVPVAISWYGKATEKKA